MKSGLFENNVTYRLFTCKSCVYNMCVYISDTMTDVYTAAMLLMKPSSDDHSGFRHDFGAKALLPLTQSAPVLYIDL